MQRDLLATPDVQITRYQNNWAKWFVCFGL